MIVGFHSIGSNGSVSGSEKEDDFLIWTLTICQPLFVLRFWNLNKILKEILINFLELFLHSTRINSHNMRTIKKLRSHHFQAFEENWQQLKLKEENEIFIHPRFWRKQTHFFASSVYGSIDCFVFQHGCFMEHRLLDFYFCVTPLSSNQRFPSVRYTPYVPAFPPNMICVKIITVLGANWIYSYLYTTTTDYWIYKPWLENIEHSYTNIFF